MTHVQDNMQAILHELVLIKATACFCVAATYSVGFRLTRSWLHFVCALVWALVGFLCLAFGSVA